MTRADAIGVARTIAACTVFGAIGLWSTWPRRADEGSCWRDTDPSAALDFDFYTGIDGRPHRCGYLPDTLDWEATHRAGFTLRGSPAQLRCYPLVREECPK